MFWFLSLTISFQANSPLFLRFHLLAISLFMVRISVSLDFSSMALISNCGPFFLILSIQIVLLLCYFLLSFYCALRNPFLRKLRWFCSGVRWNSLIRILIEGMLELSLFAFLNIYEFTEMSPASTTAYVSLIISCIALLILFTFFFGIFRVLSSK